MANFARLNVNDVECLVDMDGRRGMKACVTCGHMTQGRMTTRRDGGKTEQVVVCLKHGMALAIETAFAPVGQAVKAMREAAEGSGIPRTQMSGGTR